jgi:acetylglutamate kinase
MMSPGDKLTALACHLTKKVIKAELLTYLTTNSGVTKPGREKRFILSHLSGSELSGLIQVHMCEPGVKVLKHFLSAADSVSQ